MGARIDHGYADAVLAAQVRDAYIDREARKGQSPSDPAPVVVDVTVPHDRWGGSGGISSR
jgi:exodeoxyribonuclease-3